MCKNEQGRINKFGCYEAKIEESESSFTTINPWHCVIGSQKTYSTSGLPISCLFKSGKKSCTINGRNGNIILLPGWSGKSKWITRLEDIYFHVERRQVYTC